ncbi:uncharacterized protein LOC126188675 [Schistocerca cancellata]|uniref:uncharacterized protein LOC126188675 n=1 Tax=Schistocerca cancellata TaxID=274614 RepID=UPI0021186A2D|nr:uncharacterized protein LOC126188675 [Schistocerca cancellata]
MGLQAAVRLIFSVACIVSAASACISCDPRVICSEPDQIVCSKDCSKVMKCGGDDQEGYFPVAIMKCAVDDDMKCSATKKACVPAEESRCVPRSEDERLFICRGEGNFPDPYNCQKYHMCPGEGEISQPASCRGNSAYNSLKNDCSLKISDRFCTEGPIKSCGQPGQMGIVEENPAMYYVCRMHGDELVPEVYGCPEDTIFDLSLKRCVETEED